MFIGLNLEKFGTHSCRAGGATHLASQDWQHEPLVSGHWKDPRSLGSYVEFSDKQRFSLSSKLNL
jgi:hypothetical protein